MVRAPLPPIRPAADEVDVLPIESAAEADERVARISEELAVDPPFVPRVPVAREHGSYLEAFHESALRSLAVIHLRLAQGNVDGATELVKALRDHIDVLWEQRKVEAVREVRP